MSLALRSIKSGGLPAARAAMRLSQVASKTLMKFTPGCRLGKCSEFLRNGYAPPSNPVPQPCHRVRSPWKMSLSALTTTVSLTTCSTTFSTTTVSLTTWGWHAATTVAAPDTAAARSIDLLDTFSNITLSPHFGSIRALRQYRSAPPKRHTSFRRSQHLERTRTRPLPRKAMRAHRRQAERQTRQWSRLSSVTATSR